MNYRESGMLLLGAAIGAAVGASVALLTAPQSGYRTRRRIKRGAEELQDRLIEAGEELADLGAELVERSKTYVDEKSQVAKKTIESVKG